MKIMGVRMNDIIKKLNNVILILAKLGKDQSSEIIETLEQIINDIKNRERPSGKIKDWTGLISFYTNELNETIEEKNIKDRERHSIKIKDWANLISFYTKELMEIVKKGE